MPIDPNRVQAVFLAAAEIPDAAARDLFVSETCGEDLALKARVEALLRAHHQPDSLLDEPLVSSPSHSQPETQGQYPERDHSDTKILGFEGDDEEDGYLQFLESSKRPDSLGRIGHYEMLQILGKGGFGIVFRAFDDALQRVVAIKVMAPQLAVTSPARKRFLREARTSAKVRHENVVQVYEVAEQPLPYLAMEFIPGETLQQRLDRIGPIEPAEVVRIGRQVAEGLAAAHATDLIHRDIKPGNILLESGTQKVKLTDFGLARAADDASISQSGIIAGTPMYMAPEQALGNKLDQRADLFSLGSVLYQMVTGRPPFRATSTLGVLKRVSEDSPRDIREIIPEAPRWLCEIIAKLHAKNPDDRFQSAREVADVLADCEGQLKAFGKLKNFSRIPTSQGKTKSGTNPRGILAIGIPAMLVLTAGAWFYIWTMNKPDGNSTSGKDAQMASGRETSVADAFYQRIAELPAVEQVKEIRKEMLRRNPDFDGMITPTIEGEVITGVKFSPVGVTDLSPIRALPGLIAIDCRGGVLSKGQLTDLSPLRGLKLSTLEIEWTDVSDLTPLAGMPLTTLSISATGVSDLSPLRGLSLQVLNADNCPISDLSPLAGMPLEVLNCSYTGVSTLSPLKGMRLRTLWANNSEISDLNPLAGMPLDQITIQNTKVSDLTPLLGMPISIIYLDYDGKRDRDTLSKFPMLQKINDKPAEDFFGKKEGGKPVRPGLTDLDANRIAALPVGEQIEEVRKALMSLNPGFDGVLEITRKGEEVSALKLSTEHIENLSPVRALTKLSFCEAVGTVERQGILGDLSPLKSLPLKKLSVSHNRVTDLSPLKGMPIQELYLDRNPVKDFSPLKDMPLKRLQINRIPLDSLRPLEGLELESLDCIGLEITDLSPLRKMPLKSLMLHATSVSDLGPLAGMKLEVLNLHRTKVADLSPLKGMPLCELSLRETAVTDLSPIKEMPLRKIFGDFDRERDYPILRAIKTLELINDRPAAGFLE